MGYAVAPPVQGIACHIQTYSCVVPFYVQIYSYVGLAGLYVGTASCLFPKAVHYGILKHQRQIRAILKAACGKDSIHSKCAFHIEKS